MVHIWGTRVVYSTCFIYCCFYETIRTSKTLAKLFNTDWKQKSFNATKLCRLFTECISSWYLVDYSSTKCLITDIVLYMSWLYPGVIFLHSTGGVADVRVTASPYSVNTHPKSYLTWELEWLCVVQRPPREGGSANEFFCLLLFPGLSL